MLNLSLTTVVRLDLCQEEKRLLRCQVGLVSCYINYLALEDGRKGLKNFKA